MNGWRARSARLRTGVASSRVRFEQRAAEVRRRPQRALAWGAGAAALVLVLGVGLLHVAPARRRGGLR
ncbi:MAG: hypothetical protein V9F04_14645 [Dermatophilaceae bacterium]